MIKIRHAAVSEKKKIFDWYTFIISQNESKIWSVGQEYTWDEFNADFQDFYFEKSAQHKGSVMIIENGGEEIGCMCYDNNFLKPHCTELDIWMKNEECCGKGLGVSALKELITYLKTEKGIKKFLIRPSIKNIRAIKAYKKAGFTMVSDKKKTIEAYLKRPYLDKYGDGDYGFDDTAVLILE